MGIRSLSMMKNYFSCLLTFMLFALFSCSAIGHTRWGTGAQDVDAQDDMLSTIGGPDPAPPKKTWTFNTKGLSREEALFFGDGLPAETLLFTPRARVRYAQEVPTSPLNKLHKINRMLL